MIDIVSLFIFCGTDEWKTAIRWEKSEELEFF